MIRDDYTAWLSLPPQVASIDSNWGRCDLHWQLPKTKPVAIGVPVPTPATETTKAVLASAGSGVAAPTPDPT